MSRCVLTILVTSLALSSCQEFLPPRDDPNNYFSTEISVYYDVLYPINEESNRNQLIIMLKMVNEYDEVIQDYVEISGKIELEWLVSPTENQYGVDPKKTFTLTQANIYRVPGYDPTTGMLTIAPRETVMLASKWNFTSNDKTSMIGRFTQVMDRGCLVEDAPGHSDYRRVTLPQKFKITASARLTKKTSTFYFKPFFFSQCFVVPYKASIPQADGKRCRPETGIDPCTLVN